MDKYIGESARLIREMFSKCVLIIALLVPSVNKGVITDVCRVELFRVTCQPKMSV